MKKNLLIVALFLFALTIFFVPQVPSAHAYGSNLAVDGVTGGNSLTSSCNTNVLVTTQADVFLVFLTVNDTSVTVSSVTGNSLSWSLRKSAIQPPNVEMFEYSSSSNSILPVSVTFTTNKNADLFCDLIAIAGAFLPSPFDNSPSIPVANMGSSSPISLSYTTYQKIDLLIFSFGFCSSAGLNPSAPLNFQQEAGISNSPSNCSGVFQSLESAATVTSQQSSFSPTSSFGVGSYAAIGDAVIAFLPQLFLDGTSQFAGSGQCTLSLSTQGSNDVIIALIMSNDTTSSVTGITGNNLVWTQRNYFKTTKFQSWEFYATTSSPKTMNIFFSIVTVNAIFMCRAFGVSGTNIVSPFDLLLSKNVNNGTNSHPKINIVTANPNDMVLFLHSLWTASFSDIDNCGAQPVSCVPHSGTFGPALFTILSNLGVVWGNGGVPDANLNVGYLITTSKVNISPEINYTVSRWAIFSDAIVPSAIPPSNKVLFLDDFLYKNPAISSLWTIDKYYYPGALDSLGLVTSSGYLVLRTSNLTTAQARYPEIEGVHVTTPVWTPMNDTLVKRKLTVALIPFTAADPGTDGVWIRAGFGPLMTSGTYPTTTFGVAPPSFRGVANAPNMDTSRDCNTSTTATDNYGIEYLEMSNKGTVNAVSCASPGVTTRTTIATGLDVTKYTVFTVEYFSSLSTLSQGASWVYYRIYQENSNNNIIVGSDNSLNITDITKVTPTYQTNYVFVGVTWTSNTHVAIGSTTSEIDFVQLQNYGSPVDLRIPPIIPLPSPNVSSGLIGLLAAVAQGLGFGDIQFGAIILFGAVMGLFALPMALFTKHAVITGGTGILVTALFAYAGFIPTYTITLMLFTTAAITVFLFRKVVGL